MGLRRASWCDHDSVRIPFRIAAGRGWQKLHTALLCAPPPPQIQQRPPPRALTHGRAHSRSRAPQVERPPAGPRWPRAPALAVPLRRAVQGRGAGPWSPKAGLRGPLSLPAPPRRQRQVRVHNCQARPQPPPAGFPAPRDYRSCRGSVAGSRGRGLGAGRDCRGRGAGPTPPPERAGSPKPLPRQGGRPRRVGLRCHGDHQPRFLWDWPELKFPDPLSLRSTRVPGRPRGWPMVTGVFGLSWLMRGWEPVGRLQRGLRQAPEASLPGPFSGRAPRPQCGRLRSRRSRDGGGAPGRP
nr:basic salivary proline-rich protein 2-like [Pan troglodytes]